MEELRDIQGLDQISNWPLAIGWWILIGFAIILLAVGCVVWYKNYKYRCSWQFNSYQKLTTIEKAMGREEPKKLLQELSEELKRIAMQTKTREACAGLVGTRWLQWLQEHDPLGFNWQDQGQLLVQYQYKPMITNSEDTQLGSLITAAKAWVHKC